MAKGAGKRTDSAPEASPDGGQVLHPQDGATKKLDAIDQFALERIFPSPLDALKPSANITADSGEVLVVLDTNALLLPYEIGVGRLITLREVYDKLAKERRLFIPGRALREFAQHHGRKLADILQALRQRKNLSLPTSELPHLLEDSQSSKDLAKAHEELTKSQSAYAKALDKVITDIEEWRENDPIASMYSQIFDESIVINLGFNDTEKAALLQEWKWRIANKIPPGYKDAAKDVSIGDFLIWKPILLIGETHGKHCAFVTGDQKADWFVRSGGSGIFARPELADEYRRITKGKNLSLISLNELLRQMKAPREFVDEVKTAEDIANTAFQTAAESGSLVIEGGTVGGRIFGRRAFDYSTNDGKILLGSGDASFTLRFSKASDRAIYIYRDGTNLSKIARVKGPIEDGQVVSLGNYDSTSRVYTINVGEHFLARNRNGRLLLGQILGVDDDSRGAEHDEVRFSYVINVESDTQVLARG